MVDNVERALGVVIGKLDGIDARLDRQDESPAKLHQRLDEQTMRLTHKESDVASLKNKVEAHDKVTVEVTTLRTNAEGAGTAGRWLLRLGIGIVTFAGWLLGIYTWMTGNPPP
ncbi:MAG: DUF1515 family protein [Rhizobiaceae bacterium]|nr:DUF1515 family protein [Rhizobiaceae bacterium]